MGNDFVCHFSSPEQGLVCHIIHRYDARSQEGAQFLKKVVLSNSLIYNPSKMQKNEKNDYRYVCGVRDFSAFDKKILRTSGEREVYIFHMFWQFGRLNDSVSLI